MTLALLLTAVTGAWAQEETLLTTITAADNSSFKSGSQTFGDVATVTLTGDYLINDGSHGGWYCQGSNKTATISVAAANGANITSVKFYTAGGGSAEDKEAPFEVTTTSMSSSDITTYLNGNSIGSYGVSKIEVYGTAEPPIEVTPVAEPAANTKQWTFSMPGSDVVLTPQYAPTAKWDVVETVPQLPAALEGIIAGQDAAIVTAGQSAQGTVMYAVTTTAEPAPALTAFSATVPTAKDYDDAATVYVWYYIKGADTPEGQDPTAENTFSDSEICATPITVTVLSNKFDITFKAANDNTIEAGKATVTVGGTAATVTEGKLEGVKMGSEVKVKANTGYKFRKVEVKKKASTPSLNITNPAVGQVIGSDGKNYVSGTLPTDVTPVAKICYVDGDGHGLALALTDEESYMNWSTAQTTCAAHTPAFTGGTWKLATKDEWNSMISAIGSDVDLRDGFGFVGGTNMQSDGYWSSTEDGSDKAWDYDFNYGYWFNASKSSGFCVRACLAF